MVLGFVKQTAIVAMLSFQCLLLGLEFDIRSHGQFRPQEVPRPCLAKGPSTP